MTSETVRGIAGLIGVFYLYKHNNNYKAAQEELNRLYITSIDVRNGEVIIHTSRPGLLIGKKGENINNLVEHLKMKVKIIEGEDWVNLILPDYSLSDFEL